MASLIEFPERGVACPCIRPVPELLAGLARLDRFRKRDDRISESGAEEAEQPGRRQPAGQLRFDFQAFAAGDYLLRDDRQIEIAATAIPTGRC
jgi:hypothetical protein